MLLNFGKKKKTSMESAPTYIGNGMKIDGKIRGVRPIWIDGEIYGSIECHSEVMIGQSAKLQASIRAKGVIVNGWVDGDVFASEWVEVLEDGRVHGDVTTAPGCLTIHEGAVIKGNCLTFSDADSITSAHLIELEDEVIALAANN